MPGTLFESRAIREFGPGSTLLSVGVHAAIITAALVSVSSLGMPMHLGVTSDLVYIRFHGLAGGAAHDYTRAELQPWAAHISDQASRGRRVFAYFNNDANVRAPANAKLLMELTGSCWNHASQDNRKLAQAA